MRDVVLEIRIAAVDDDVAGFEQTRQFDNRVMGDRAGRQHHPDSARLVEPAHEFGKVMARRRPLASKRADRVVAFVVDDAAMPGAHQPPHDIAAHPAEPDHPELHWNTPL